MKLTEALFILEVANHKSGEYKTAIRLQNALDQLKKSNLGGCPIVFVFSRDSDDNPCQVPDFGHDYKCQCEHPEPWGVSRYFRFFGILAGAPSTDALGDYQITEYARLTFSGIVEPRSCDGYFQDLKRL